jgi:glycerophosphoryl diester phosphodiesterase
MKIISHRGYWLEASEKNTPLAFDRSFGLGFGTETDVRDCMGELVISHDMPSGNEQGLEDFLVFAGKFASVKSPLTLALNIKADGMADVLAKKLSGYPQLNCFVFDMAVPDMRNYLNAGIPVFTRMSEIELAPAFLNSAEGVWLDAFEKEWYDTKVIDDLISAGKKVCIVSPEIHGRPHMDAWQILNKLDVTDGVILCTDKPEDALGYFQGVRV